VLYAERIEDLGSGPLPAAGFQGGVKLSYSGGPDASFLGLKDDDFRAIENDELYNTIADLSQGCALAGVYGVTYKEGTGIHDAHMNSGTDKHDPHAAQDRQREDGAVAFYFHTEAGGQSRTYAHWVLIKFDSQKVVNP
jgi:hypothetical protein